jgi:hypothetical protein
MVHVLVIVALLVTQCRDRPGSCSTSLHTVCILQVLDTSVVLMDGEKIVQQIDFSDIESWKKVEASPRAETVETKEKGASSSIQIVLRRQDGDSAQTVIALQSQKSSQIIEAIDTKLASNTADAGVEEGIPPGAKPEPEPEPEEEESDEESEEESEEEEEEDARQDAYTITHTSEETEPRRKVKTLTISGTGVSLSAPLGEQGDAVVFPYHAAPTMTDLLYTITVYVHRCALTAVAARAKSELNAD